MNAKHRNESHRQLFRAGDLSPILWADEQLSRGIAEIKEASRQKFFPEAVAECPCHCGLRNAVCDAQLERVRLANEELPF